MKTNIYTCEKDGWSPMEIKIAKLLKMKYGYHLTKVWTSKYYIVYRNDHFGAHVKDDEVMVTGNLKTVESIIKQVKKRSWISNY